MQLARPRPRVRGFRMPPTSAYIMAIVLIVLGFYLIWPVLLLVINSFDARADWFVGDRQWGLQHWRDAWSTPGLVGSLGNSIMIWAFVVGISFPIAVLISWVLARTNIPFSHGIEFLFWISFMMPGIATTIAWITLMDPDIGLLNIAIAKLPFIENGPFNIFTVQGIVWAHLMANGISIKVMLLTPAFRNMDASMEEAARVSGASNILTMMRVTLPLMISPMALVFALQLLRIFQSFETELLLGLPFDFYVYSTKIFELVRQPVPNYGVATVLASLTLLVHRGHHSRAALDHPAPPLHHHHRQFQAGAHRPGPVESSSLRHHRLPDLHAHHRPGDIAPVRQLHDACGLLLP